MKDFITKLFNYVEPKDIEGFELLEDETEDKQSSSKSENINKTMRTWRSKSKGIQKDNLLRNLEFNIKKLEDEFNAPTNKDLVVRKFKIAKKYNACLFFIEGMVDQTLINDFILRELMKTEHFKDFNGECPLTHIEESVISINQVTRADNFEETVSQILNGLSALLVQDCSEALLIETRGYEKRNVEKPITENVIRGAHEGFSENLRTNITLIRRIIRNKNLVTELMTVGRTNNSSCAIIYLEDIANPSIVKEVKRRIKKLDTDYIAGSGMLEEQLSDNAQSIFPHILTTERPDRASSFISDGKVVILIDGAPFASAVPTTFIEALQSPEDFFLKWQFSTALRIVRLIGIFCALFLPGLYIALILFHQEMLPTELLTSIARSRENVPFPTILEIIMMEVSFELIREAGIRVPGAIGTTLGIIGALVLGQAAVSAQIVSPILIIIVAVTGIGSFAVPTYALAFAIRLIRFLFILVGAFAGFYGMAFGIFVIAGLACSIKSFGVPYFAPVAPKTKSNQDIILSRPIYAHKYRPDYQNPLNKRRRGK